MQGDQGTLGAAGGSAAVTAGAGQPSGRRCTSQQTNQQVRGRQCRNRDCRKLLPVCHGHFLPASAKE
jgi:hypothetical protein